MTLVLFLLLLLLAAVVAGFVGSLAGMGGGVVVMPVLIIFFHVPFLEAIGASAVSVLATSAASGSTAVRNNLTDVRIALFLEIATVPGAFLGVAVAVVLANTNLTPVLLVLLGVVLLMTLPSTLHKWGEEIPEGVVADATSRRLHLGGTYHDRHLEKNVTYQAGNTKGALATMFGAGVVSGMFGIGSGVLKVVALERYLRLPMKVATATSNLMIGVTVAAGVSVLLAGGYINPALAAPVALGTTVGSLAGSQILPRLSNRVVRIFFIPVLAILAIEVILRGLGIA